MSQSAVAVRSEEDAAIDRAVEAAAGSLLAAQRPDGHWVFELEADATIPAEYVLLRHYLGEPVDEALEAKIAAYLLRIQMAEGGWPLFHGGAFNISASVKAYFALKMTGRDPDEPAMRRARETIRANGGASGVNVFTRVLLALYGVLDWRAVPVMPVEIMLLPKWFPFHLDKISYWARTVIAPLLVLAALKPRAVNPKGVGIDELFLEPPATVGPLPRAEHQSRAWFAFFRAVDVVLRRVEPLFPKGPRKRATEKAVAFVVERLNGEDGLGAIFPAMANSVMMFDALAYPTQHPDRLVARQSIDKLLVVGADEAYCQPCVSPVWDTALACHAMMEAGDARSMAAARAGLDWLVPRQVLDVAGDWAAQRPDVAPGGWAFQYANPHYPDLDDTAVVVMGMDRERKASGEARYGEAIARGRTWVVGLQSRDGGWGAFDADNSHLYLNNIPFSDHGALLDPPTEDVTGRCVSMLAQLGPEGAEASAMRGGVDYLRRTQRADGSWWGRWGLNYIYGTWSALCALRAAGLGPEAPEIRRARDWLIKIQNADGGWGEAGESYKLDYDGHEASPSTSSQTAWAMLGLMAAGAGSHEAVAKGARWLMETQRADGSWNEEIFTATGFPRVFYLRYHGYRRFFPLWALARLRRLRAGGAIEFGM